MAAAKTLEVTLLGRSFKVTCTDEEREALLHAVAYVDGKMQEIRQAGRVTGTERIAVMAALNIAHELLSMRVGGVDLGQAKRRLAALEARLDAGMAQQEKLF